MPYFDPATAESEEQHYLKVAADLVQRYAPVPDPEPADYAAKAARAERILLGYLQNTSGGQFSSLSGKAGSLSFRELKAIREVVSGAMGDYYTGGISTVGYIGAFPR